MSRGQATTLLMIGLLLALPVAAQRDGLPSDQDYGLAIESALQYLSQKDYDRAFPWVLKSAQYGDKGSQHLLSLLYLNGLGAEVDYARAYAWAATAAESEATRSLKLQDHIARMFNSAQLTVARRLANAYQDEYGMAARDIVCGKRTLRGSDRKRTRCMRKHQRASNYASIPGWR